MCWSNVFSDAGTEISASARSATLDCNDVTSVIAFLAFLFALLNFVLNMQVDCDWWRPGHNTQLSLVEAWSRDHSARL